MRVAKYWEAVRIVSSSACDIHNPGWWTLNEGWFLHVLFESTHSLGQLTVRHVCSFSPWRLNELHGPYIPFRQLCSQASFSTTMTPANLLARPKGKELRASKGQSKGFVDHALSARTLLQKPMFTRDPY